MRESKKENVVKQPSFWMSMTHAWSGLVFTVRSQRNARIHIVAGVVVIAMAVWLRLGTTEISILVLTIGAVMAGETVNTTVEAIVDLLSPEWHASAKIAKDVSAGAVLILGLTSIVVGLLILGPPLWEQIVSLL